MKFGLSAGVAFVTVCCIRPAPAAAPETELAEFHEWISTIFKEGRSDVHPRPDQPTAAMLPQTQVPFSFQYGGKPFVTLLTSWAQERSSRRLDGERTEYIVRYADRTTGLVLRCVAVAYDRFPTVEWTLHFKNTGSADTPILENIQALDIQLERGPSGEFLLHHNTGSPADGSDYGPLQTPLGPGARKRLGAAGGRPTNADWSYFNVEAAGQGMIVVVGWPGQWAAELTRDHGRGLRIRAGQELTHFKLHPGEEVRSPLMVLQAWKGDWIGAQNVWRRWMMAYGMPRPGGKLPPSLMFASSSRQYGEMIHATEENQIHCISRYLEEGLKIDYWWMDAGWYVNKGGWPDVGTWEVDRQRFPQGLRAISDFAHRKGVKILVWFEPERVSANSWLARNHPAWVLGGAKGGLLNLGLSEARRWLTDHIDKMLTEQGIDLYRQDFNMDPLPYWRAQDTSDRQGLTEIRHVTGYLAFWDELRRRHPNLLIDSCASGGRRNDLETMRRAVPLWRSDYAFEPIGHQCMTYGISMWLPYYGTGTVAASNASYYGSGHTPVEPYAFWSNAAPGLGCGFDIRLRDLDYRLLRQLFCKWREVSANYYGDFYPLTPWSRADTTWMAWQFDRPEAGTGMVQVFRRRKSPVEAAVLKLRGLDANAKYTLKDGADSKPRELTGQELMNIGLRVVMKQQPGAMVITYSNTSAAPASRGR